MIFLFFCFPFNPVLLAHYFLLLLLFLFIELTEKTERKNNTSRELSYSKIRISFIAELSLFAVAPPR